MDHETSISGGESIDFSQHVYPPYHGEATHPDPTRLIVPIGSVHRDPENARLHPDRNLRKLRASLRREARGQQSAIKVDRKGKVLKGNGTHEAAELESWQYIWIEVSNLEGAEATAYSIADNSTGLSSQWGFEQLAENVRSLKAFDETEFEFTNDDLGFEEHEISPLLAADWTPPSATDDPQTAPSDNAPAMANNKSAADPHADLEDGDKARDDCKIVCTPNQRELIDRAIERVRLLSGEMTLTEGRCIELVCADYCADPNHDLPPEMQIRED